MDMRESGMPAEAGDRKAIQEDAMREKIRTKISYANVMSTIAVFFALGGGAVYAAQSIGSGDIRSDAIQSQHLATNAITSAAIASNAVRSVDIKRNAIKSSDIRAGAIKRSDIRAGAITNTAITGSLPIATTVRTEDFAVLPEQTLLTNLECQADETPVGGGVRINTNAAQTELTQSAPNVVSGNETVWQLEISNSGGGTYTGFVSCMETSA